MPYYDRHINKICTRTLCDKEGLPHIEIDEYMKHRLQAKLVEAIKGQDEHFAPLTTSSVFAVW